MNYYYADSDKQPVGPVSETELRSLCNERKITLDTLITSEESRGEEWKPYSTLAVSPPPDAIQSPKMGLDIARLDTPKLLAIVGAVLLCFAAFTPVVSFPVIGGINFLKIGWPAYVTLCFAAVTIYIVFAASPKFLWITGGGILLLLLGCLDYFLYTMYRVASENANNPLGVAIMMQAIQLQWGCFVLALGAVSIFAGAFLSTESKYIQLMASKWWTWSAIVLLFAPTIGLSILGAIPTKTVTTQLTPGTGTGSANTDESKAQAEVRNPSATDLMKKAWGDSRRESDLKTLTELRNRKIEFEKKLAALRVFRVLDAKYYKEDSIAGKYPVIELTVQNDTQYSVKCAYFRGVVSSPGRSVPWINGTFIHTISGGIEPGEKANWKLAQNKYMEWGRDDAPADALFTVTVYRLDGPDDKELFGDAEFSEYDQKRLEELESKYGQKQGSVIPSPSAPAPTASSGASDIHSRTPSSAPTSPSPVLDSSNKPVQKAPEENTPAKKRAEQRAYTLKNPPKQIRTVRGLVFTGVKILSIDEDGINITHDYGNGKVRTQDLPPATQEAFGLDPQLTSSSNSAERQEK